MRPAAGEGGGKVRAALRSRGPGPAALLALVWALSAGAPPASASPTPVARYQAMCAFVQADGARTVACFLDPSRVGRRGFDDVYGAWYHSVGQVKEYFGPFRRGGFSDALKGVVAEESALLASAPGQAAGPASADASRVAAVLAAGKSLQKAVADGDLDLATVQRWLLSTGSAVWNVQFLKEMLGRQGVGADVAAVVALPVAASERARRVVAEIKLSSTDPDLGAACDQLLDEIEHGKRDYVERVVKALGDGKTARWLEKKLAEHATAALIVGPLLERLGLISVAGQATTIVGLLFTGAQVVLSLSGEDEAYSHARLAHFADALKPGLCKRWAALGAQLDPDRPELGPSFDAASQAAILLAAFVSRQGREMEEAYRKASLHLTGAAQDTYPGPEGFAAAYRDWLSGETFRDYAAPAAAPPEQ